MKKEKINACPFCGSNVCLVQRVWYGNSRTLFKVYCSGCQVSQQRQKTRKGAIAQWNERAEGDK